MLVAASRTVDGRDCHALRVDFLSPARPSVPLEYRVRRTRDGRRFTVREVSAWQGEREIALGTASFTEIVDDSEPYQREPTPTVASPEGLRTELEHRLDAAHRMSPDDRRWLLDPRGVEVRQVHPVPLFDPSPVAPVAHTWLRALGPLPEESTIHRAVLAYASDMTLLDIACYPRGLSWIDPRVEQASLSHAIWFHRAFRADEWLLYSQDVPLIASGRALARGSVFTESGALVASVVQEGVSRLV